jgi:RND family efflux transporter MFP subunit
MLAPKNNGRVLLKLGVALVILAGIAVAAFFMLRQTAQVVAVKRGQAEDAVVGSVTIDADGGIKELKSEAPGKVIDVHGIKKGKKFSKGDPLVLLDRTDLERAAKEATRKYEEQQKTAEIEMKLDTQEEDATRALENMERLQKLNDATFEQVREVQRRLNQVKTAKALREFRTQVAKEDYEAAKKERELLLEKMTVPAPSDGEIHEAKTWAGALIGAGQVVAEFISNERVVAARISEEDFGRVKVGQRARLRLLTYGSETYDATVSDLFPVADEAQRFQVFLKVEVDSDRLKPRSTGEVTITIDKRENVQTIPRRALINGNQVLVVKNGVVELRTVEVGFKSLSEVEIRGGLQDGEYVIIEDVGQFRPGMRVGVEVKTY